MAVLSLEGTSYIRQEHRLPICILLCLTVSACTLKSWAIARAEPSNSRICEQTASFAYINYEIDSHTSTASFVPGSRGFVGSDRRELPSQPGLQAAARRAEGRGAEVHL